MTSRPNIASPPLGQTGGFGETTCHSCHNELELDSPDAGRVTLDGLPEQYRPGESYLINVILDSSEMMAAGFEMSFRFAGSSPPGEQAGIQGGKVVGPPGP